MKITRRGNILLEDQSIYQGAINGRITAYPLDRAMAALGVSAAEIAAASPDDAVPGIQDLSYRQAFEHPHIVGGGQIIRRGSRVA